MNEKKSLYRMWITNEIKSTDLCIRKLDLVFRILYLQLLVDIWVGLSCVCAGCR